MAGNDHPLDLAGTLVDLGDLGVAHHALHGILAGVAVAAEQLDGPARDIGGSLGGEQLRHGGVHGIVLVILLLHGSGVHQVLGGLHPGVHIGQLELGVLELAQALAELDTLLGVLDGLVDSALAQAQGLRGDADPAAVQGLHGDREALALFAQQVLLGDDAVLKDQVAGGGAADAHLLLVLAGGEAGEALFHNEGGDAVVALGLVGHGKDHEGVSHVAVGDEALGAVEDVVVALQHRHGLLAGGIGTGVGLGQAEGADLLAGEQVRQVLALLLLGAVLKDRGAAQGGMCGNDDSSGAADLGQLLHAHGVGQNVAAGAAVLLGEVNTHHPQLGHLLDGLHGEPLFFVDLLGQGLHFVLGEFTVHLPEHLLLVCQMKIHIPLTPLLVGAQDNLIWNNHRSPCRSSCPAGRRGPSCAAAGRDDTCCRRSRCTGSP